PRIFGPRVPVPADVTDVRVFCGGCLVIGGPSYAHDPEAGARLAAHPAFADWPLVVLTDDARRAARSAINFLWTTFTRFEPAADVHAAARPAAPNRPLGGEDETTLRRLCGRRAAAAHAPAEPSAAAPRDPGVGGQRRRRRRAHRGADGAGGGRAAGARPARHHRPAHE